ncbi:hypothetical protein Bpro_2202 [Polaromonas sp. JS666]|nr:hypothetical protein Bpro_2202 [Polaromonas sp. JS666]
MRCSFTFVRGGQVLPHPALPLHRLWRRTPYDAEGSCFQHVQPARTGITQAVPVFIAQKPLPADGGIRAQGAHDWFAFAPGLEHWQKCAVLDAGLKAFTQTSTWLHKHSAHFTEASLTAPASCLRRIGFYPQRQNMRSH